MKLPVVIDSNLPVSALSRWKLQFKNVSRDYMEGLWRRTQSEINAVESGKTTDKDQRRRLIHFFDKYDVVDNGDGSCSFVIVSPWLWLCISSPKNEIDGYLGQIESATRDGLWEVVYVKEDSRVYTNRDLELKVRLSKNIKEDIENDRYFPEDYLHLEIEIAQKNAQVSEDVHQHVWSVLNSGFRDKDKRGNPEIITDLKAIEKYLPMQLELGCGPSIECGIPPLHYLHEVYYVTDIKTHKFIFGPENDLLLKEIIADPLKFYKQASKPIGAAICAEPSQFYRLVKKLFDNKTIVGPIITNNFDGLCSYLGMPEIYVRRYDEVHIVPKVDFDPRAKSLMVVGSHADRRRIQSAARKQGLKVIYVDPEGYLDSGGRFTEYPLEGPQDTDLLIRATGNEFVEKWNKAFRPDQS